MANKHKKQKPRQKPRSAAAPSTASNSKPTTASIMNKLKNPPPKPQKPPPLPPKPISTVPQKPNNKPTGPRNSNKPNKSSGPPPPPSSSKHNNNSPPKPSLPPKPSSNHPRNPNKPNKPSGPPQPPPKPNNNIILRKKLDQPPALRLPPMQPIKIPRTRQSSVQYSRKQAEKSWAAPSTPSYHSPYVWSPSQDTPSAPFKDLWQKVLSKLKQISK